MGNFSALGVKVDADDLSKLLASQQSHFLMSECYSYVETLFEDMNAVAVRYVADTVLLSITDPDLMGKTDDYIEKIRAKQKLMNEWLASVMTPSALILKKGRLTPAILSASMRARRREIFLEESSAMDTL